jgi:hypothetical protein
MVFCVYCGRAFSRHEHLQRHVLTRKLKLQLRPSPNITNIVLSLTCASPPRYQDPAVQMCHLPYFIYAPVGHSSQAGSGHPCLTTWQ